MRRSWLRLFWAAVIVAGAAVAYLVTSDYGARLLHDEIESQLTRRLGGPVDIAEVDFDWREGIWVEARGLEAFPASEASAPPALRIGHVRARLDVLALLVGRLELASLSLDGPRLRIERAADGSWANLPLPAPAQETDEPAPNDDDQPFLERWAGHLAALDSVAEGFVDRFHIADRIEISDGALTWVDLATTTDESAPSEIRLELIQATAEREWLDDGVSLEIQAVVVDGVNAPFSARLSVQRDDDASPLAWSVEWTGMAIERFGRIAGGAADGLEVAGLADAKVTLETVAPGRKAMRVESVFRNLKLVVPAADMTFHVEDAELVTAAELDDQRLRVTEGRASGDRLAIDFKGVVDRPLRTASRARIESRMVGIGVDDLRGLLRRIDSDADLALGLTRLLERIETGRITHIETAGTARVSRWREILSGHLQAVPDGFLLSGAVEDVTVGTGSDAHFEGVSGELEWAQDQLSFRDMAGRFNGRPLPQMNAILHGVSHLIRAPDAARTLVGNYVPTPGVGPLIEILEPRDPGSLPPVKALALAIDRLDHPALRYPLRNVRMLVEPLRGGVEVNVREGTWAGAAVSGDLVWTSGRDRSQVDAQLVLGPPPVPSASGPGGDANGDPGGAPDAPDVAAADASGVTTTDVSRVTTTDASDAARDTPEVRTGVLEATTAPAAAAPIAPDRWGEGRFEVQFRPSPTLPFRRGLGYFRLSEAQLSLNEVEIDLDPQGKAALRTRVDLDDADAIGLDLSFAITGARMEGMNQFVALPADLVTGDAGATGSLAGPVRPDTSFVAELEGRVRVDIDSGRLAMGLPLLFRLSKATEGYNPFANADEIEFESLGTTIGFDHGVLVSKDFEVEGPLRMFANAAIDTNPTPADIRAVVGVFLFRTSSQFIGNFPLVRSFLPGSEKGLLGAYFDVDGPIDEPEISALPTKTLMTAVPDAIKAPFKVLGFLFGRSGDDS